MTADPTPDHLAALRADTARIAAALRDAGDEPIAWCGDWAVRDCAHHVAGLHRAVHRVVTGRPDATFATAFSDLAIPAADDPGLADSMTAGAAEVVDLLAATAWDEPCWSFGPAARTVAFWPRRMAHETFVHRWDVERAAGATAPAAEPVGAADGVDEYLDVFVAMMRRRVGAPGAGESVLVDTPDAGRRWVVGFPAPGERTLARGDGPADAVLSGPAEAVLLHLWGRPVGADVTFDGAARVVRRWRELSPPI